MIKIGFTDWISSRVGSGRALEKEYKSLEPKEDTGQPVTDPNLQQQTAFIQETLKVFNRMEIIYSKLAELNINTQEKAKVLDEVRFAYSRLNEDALKQRLAAFNEMMAKVQKQAAYYSVGYSILKGHMPELVKAFESAKGHVKQKEVQAYTLLKGFREMIEKLPFDRFNQMQGEPANGNVCPESGWSQEVQRRFGDKRLADWLKTQETGWGKEGKTKVLELFDKRLK
ncbi:hypothetical protein KY362_04095, partial [Candidatus Woesearchaeota archaeon]|nr:hypothetical protein [Candidatus Woesearchaeota archaeon]